MRNNSHRAHKSSKKIVCAAILYTFLVNSAAAVDVANAAAAAIVADAVCVDVWEFDWLTSTNDDLIGVNVLSTVLATAAAVCTTVVDDDDDGFFIVVVATASFFLFTDWAHFSISLILLANQSKQTC